jgi:hypothetical protein
MREEPRGKPAPRIGRKDQQDPDRDARNPREGRVDREPERGPESDSPRPSDDVPPAK